MSSPSELPLPASPEHREFRVRRAPRIGVFMAAGAVVGVLVALLVATFGERSPEFSLLSTFGFFAVTFGVAGAALGALVWLLVDRRSRSTMVSVRAESVQDPAQEDAAVLGSDLQQWNERWENEQRDSSTR